ncbi:MAG: hypothetical protein DWQ05_19290 [Calditrichaeota bacterium]|nr:MAG: hypothetical protein DWQ05_19290 [Calditrichota bacterium]
MNASFGGIQFRRLIAFSKKYLLILQNFRGKIISFCTLFSYQISLAIFLKSNACVLIKIHISFLSILC